MRLINKPDYERIHKMTLKVIITLFFCLTILPVYSNNYPTIVTENTELLIPQIRFHQNSESATIFYLTDLHNIANCASYDKNNTIIKVIGHIIQGSNIINDSVKINTTIVGLSLE